MAGMRVAKMPLDELLAQHLSEQPNYSSYYEHQQAVEDELTKDRDRQYLVWAADREVLEQELVPGVTCSLFFDAGQGTISAVGSRGQQRWQSWQ